MMQHTLLSDAAIELLKQLIAKPSFSREEQGTANLIVDFLTKRGIPAQRSGHNVWACSEYWAEDKPVVLLNSHHDTVQPAAGWQRDPFAPTTVGNHLYGLGSNDAGGPLVSLLAAFLYLYPKAELPFNVVFAATAEEEISGSGGIASILDSLPPIALGIIGEPTGMQMAVAERGLLVIDAEVKGLAGHAARAEGINAIDLAMRDLAWIKDHPFERVSPMLGPVRATVTQIQAGHQHNVVPDRCHYVIDVRTQECYTNQEVLDHLQAHLLATLTPRSLRLSPSGIPLSHPVVQVGMSMGLTAFGSPTLSDQALCPFPTLKMGPGDSARSHTADEFILLSEVREGIDLYIELLERLERLPSVLTV